MENNYEVLEDLARDTFARIVWTHKIQIKQADLYSRKYNFLETIRIIAASITAAGIITLIFKNYFWVKLGSALLSFVTVFITAYLSSFNLQNLINSHKTAANKLVELRDKYKILLYDIKLQNNTSECLMSEHNKLLEELNFIYQIAPVTSNKAVIKASKALRRQNDETYFDEEIDSYLPKSLRKEQHRE